MSTMLCLQATGPSVAPRAPVAGVGARLARPAGIADLVALDRLPAAAQTATGDGASWLLPGPAWLCVVPDGGGASIRIRNREFAPLPPVALVGPTSHALRVAGAAGAVRFRVSPLGWARLLHRPASDFRDRVVPLAALTGPDLPAELVAAVRAGPGEAALGLVPDALLAPLMAKPHPDEPLIRAVIDLVADPTVVRIGHMADRLGLSDRQLRSVALRHFGMPAKVLLRRARFLRSYGRIADAADASGYADIEASYFDTSHFLRDAAYFLGTTPRRFRARAAG